MLKNRKTINQIGRRKRLLDIHRNKPNNPRKAKTLTQISSVKSNVKIAIHGEMILENKDADVDTPDEINGERPWRLKIVSHQGDVTNATPRTT